jgi:Bacteriocin-protection, YdeI or OmpD-Associated/Domain of unknown function (DUF1905)
VAHRFKAIIQTDPDSPGSSFIEVPERIMTALGPRKRIPVNVTINGYTYRSTNSIYGGVAFIPVRASVRKAANVELGDTVSVTLERDDVPRTAAVPADLAAALEKRRLREAFERFSPTHQREYVEWIESAKKPETRLTRIEKTVTATQEKAAVTGSRTKTAAAGARKRMAAAR